MQNKHKPPITNIGSVSLIMIFIVLCMVTFAILSLSESTSDYKFTEKLAEHTTAYYTASSKAENALAEIDQILHDAAQELSSDDLQISTDGNTESATNINNNADIDIDAFTTAFFYTVNTAIASMDLPSVTDLTCTLDDNNQISIAYDVAISDSQKLAVCLRISPEDVLSVLQMSASDASNGTQTSSGTPDSSDTQASSNTQVSSSAGKYYTIVTWQTIPTDEWNADDSIQLIK